MTIAQTPKPPYYSVTTTVVFNEDTAGYFQTAMELLALADDTKGFLGLETTLTEETGIAISYWQSLEDIQAWRVQKEHVSAKLIAKEKWFNHFITRIAKVERAY